MKKLFLFYLFILLPVLFVSACIFSSDDEAAAVSSWLSSQGMPDSYDVRVLEIESVPVVSYKSYRLDTPVTSYIYGTLGSSVSLSHDFYLDFAFNFTKGDTGLVHLFQESDSSTVALRLFPMKTLYESAIYKDSLPLKENLNVSVSWILTPYSSKKSLDSIVDEKDSVWYKSLEEFSPAKTFDSVYAISLRPDSAIYLSLPDSLVQSLKAVSYGGRLQIKLSAPEAKRVYRFVGHGNVSYQPTLKLSAKEYNLYLTPFRTATLISGEPSEDGVLYAGTTDSLIIQLDRDKILESLSEFYGDTFPWTKGNGMDVRQAVVLAEFAFEKDDSKGISEFNLPVQVVVSSFTGVGTENEERQDESYKLDKEVIVKSGHKNLVFYEGDSLHLQATYGLREFINKASDGEDLKLMLRLGYPVLEPKDTLYSNYINAEGDSVRFFLSYFDYAKYDFASALEKGVRLKLWLASKRGGTDE